jgi:CRP/FNR family transcriptional regulator, cyclic AMP receptor protein
MSRVAYILSWLTDSDLGWIARVGTRRRVQHGETLITRGEPIDSLVLVLEGQLLVLMQDVGTVARRGAGDVLGEMSMVDSSPPSATVIAEGECLVLLLNKNILQRKLAADLAFGSRFYRALAIILAHRLRELQEDILREDQPAVVTERAVLERDLALTPRDNGSAELIERSLTVLKGISAS